VRSQPAHQPRRGRNRTRAPSAPRKTRVRAYPHGLNPREQSGHATRPDRSRSSTLPASPSTVSTRRTLRALPAALPDTRPRDDHREGRTNPDPLTVSSHTNDSKPTGRPKIPLTRNDVARPGHAHSERRSTSARAGRFSSPATTRPTWRFRRCGAHASPT
jgi:hypothetical protein